MTRGWSVDGSDGVVVRSFLPVASSAGLAPRLSSRTKGQGRCRPVWGSLWQSSPLAPQHHCFADSGGCWWHGWSSTDLQKYGTLPKRTGYRCLKQLSLECHDGRKSSLISRSPLLMSSWAGMWHQYTSSNSPPAPGKACFRTHKCQCLPSERVCLGLLMVGGVHWPGMAASPGSVSSWQPMILCLFQSVATILIMQHIPCTLPRPCGSRGSFPEFVFSSWKEQLFCLPSLRVHHEGRACLLWWRSLWQPIERPPYIEASHE